MANLQGLVKEVVRACKPQDVENGNGVERLLQILRHSPLASVLVPDAYKKIQGHDQVRRRPGDFFFWDKRAFREMTEALRRVQNASEAKDRRTPRPHHASPGVGFLLRDGGRR